MIITLTPNPSVDRTVFVDALPRGAVIRSHGARSEPSGKGVNVALALRAHDHDALAVLPVGGPLGAHLIEMLRATDVDHITVPIAGEIRSNVSLVEPDGTVTKVNEPGPPLSAAEIEALIAAALKDTHDVTWLAACGSLPPETPSDLYARLTADAHRSGVRIAVDSSGRALRAALLAGPDLIKPNADELAEVTGRDLHTLGDVLDAAEILCARGVRAVLASLGGDGAVLLEDGVALHAETPDVEVVSTVGAGDALLAGFLSAGGSGEGALRTAMAWAAAAVQHDGTLFPQAETPCPVLVHDRLDRERRLSQPASGT
jgi:1-phosphofructokinase